MVWLGRTEFSKFFNFSTHRTKPADYRLILYYFFQIIGLTFHTNCLKLYLFFFFLNYLKTSAAI